MVWAMLSRYETSKMLWLLPDFYEIFSPTLLLFSFLFPYYLNRGEVIFWGLNTVYFGVSTLQDFRHYH